MSTLFDIDKKLTNIDFAIENITSKLVQIIRDNFDGNNSKESQINNTSYFESSYFISDSEFENVIIGIRYNGRFIITLEGRGADSPYNLKIDLDETLVNKLPAALREDLEDKYYNNLHN